MIMYKPACRWQQAESYVFNRLKEKSHSYVLHYRPLSLESYVKLGLGSFILFNHYGLDEIAIRNDNEIIENK